MQLYDSGIFLLDGKTIVPEMEAKRELREKKEQLKKGTISYRILQAHNTGSNQEKYRFEST